MDSSVPKVPLSCGQRTRKVLVPLPTRTRHDDQITEVFLHTWQDGRFAHHVEWLPQHRRNVEAVGTDANGIRVAVEHTRLFAFEDHNKYEFLVRGMAQVLETEPRLNALGLGFDFHFYPKLLRKLLRTHKRSVEQHVLDWAVHAVPALKAARPRVPIPDPNSCARRQDSEHCC